MHQSLGRKLARGLCSAPAPNPIVQMLEQAQRQEEALLTAKPVAEDMGSDLLLIKSRLKRLEKARTQTLHRVLPLSTVSERQVGGCASAAATPLFPLQNKSETLARAVPPSLQEKSASHVFCRKLLSGSNRIVSVHELDPAQQALLPSRAIARASIEYPVSPERPIKHASNAKELSSGRTVLSASAEEKYMTQIVSALQACKEEQEREPLGPSPGSEPARYRPFVPLFSQRNIQMADGSPGKAENHERSHSLSGQSSMGGQHSVNPASVLLSQVLPIKAGKGRKGGQLPRGSARQDVRGKLNVHRRDEQLALAVKHCNERFLEKNFSFAEKKREHNGRTLRNRHQSPPIEVKCKLSSRPSAPRKQMKKTGSTYFNFTGSQISRS